jgi:DNA polymerase-3 subunit epsilon
VGLGEDDQFKPWEQVEVIKSLKREKKYAEARDLLLECVRWLEMNYDDPRTPPYYYDELSKVYKALGDKTTALDFIRIYEDAVVHNFQIEKKRYQDESQHAKDKYLPHGMPISQDTIKVLLRTNRIGDAMDVSKEFVEKYLSKNERSSTNSKPSKYDFIALDVETANEDMASICQVGLAFVKDNKVTHTWGSYVDPETYFSNTWLHGIDEVTVSGAPAWPELLPSLLELVDGELIVIHTSFDRLAVERSQQRYSLPPVQLRFMDSAKMARRADERFRQSGYSLQNLCLHYEIEYKDAHDAVADAFMAAQVVLYILANHSHSISDWEDSLKKRFRSTSYFSRVKQDGVEGGPLNGLNFVFTGALATSRREIAALTANLGGNVRDTVNDQVDYLVVGVPSFTHLGADQLSKKERTARKLVEAGGKIQIITEEEFNSILEDVS